MRANRALQRRQANKRMTHDDADQMKRDNNIARCGDGSSAIYADADERERLIAAGELVREDDGILRVAKVLTDAQVNELGAAMVCGLINNGYEFGPDEELQISYDADTNRVFAEIDGRTLAR